MAEPKPKILGMYFVGYAYAGPDNKRRTGVLLVRADSPDGAKIAARTQLAKEFDWFKIMNVKSEEGDQPQQTL